MGSDAAIGKQLWFLLAKLTPFMYVQVQRSGINY